jgi:hypothetical protein
MIEYRPNRPGVAEILKSPGFRGIVDSAARDIARNVEAQRPETTVEVRRFTTDRAAASVTIAEPEGRLLQVRDGILTRAASAAGLEVRTR